MEQQLSEMDLSIRNEINKFGWSVLLIEATDYLPSFACTIGLCKNHKHPEIICFGLPVESMQHILNTAAEMVQAGKTIVPQKMYDDFFENGTAEFINVDKNNLGDYFGYVIDFYQTEDFPALQLVWTDRNHHFPWDADFEEEFKFKQPLLDRNAHFKFAEEPTLAVQCSRQFQNGSQPIIQVIHRQDGAWAFLTGDFKEEDSCTVGLAELIAQDASLNNLFNLDYGEQATRTAADAKWMRSTVQ